VPYVAPCFLVLLFQLPVHSHRIPALVPFESAIKREGPERYRNDARQHEDEETPPLEMHKEIVRQKPDKVDRKRRHKEKLEETPFEYLWRIVRGSEYSFKHGTGELSDIPEAE